MSGEESFIARRGTSAHQARQSRSDSTDPGRETSFPIPGEGGVAPTVWTRAEKRRSRSQVQETSFLLSGQERLIARRGSSAHRARHTRHRLGLVQEAPRRPISWRGASDHHVRSVKQGLRPALEASPRETHKVGRVGQPSAVTQAETLSPPI